MEKGMKGLKFGGMDGLEKVLGFAGKGGMIGIAVAGLTALGKEWLNIATGAHKAEERIEAAEKANKKFIESIQDSLARGDEWLSRWEGSFGTAGGIAAMEDHLKRVNKQLADTQTGLKEAKKQKEALADDWDLNNLRHLWNDEDVKKNEARIKSLGEAEELLLKKQLDLRRRLSEVKDPWQNPSAIKSLRAVIDEANDSVKALTRSADDMKLDKLKKEFGFKDGDLGEARLALAAKHAANADEWIRQMVRDMNNLRNGIHMTADELKLEEMMKNGLVGDKVAEIRKLIDLKKELEAKPITLKAVVKGSIEDAALDNAAKMKALDDSRKNLSGVQLQEIIRKLNDINNTLRDLPSAKVI
jgi:hypothetical protein